MANILDYIAMFQPSPKQVQDKLSQAIEASWETSPAGLMPLRKNRLTGEMQWIVPPALEALFGGVTAPERALSGELPAYAEDANGKVTLNPQMADDAAALASTIALGAAPIPKPKNALGMFGGEMAKTADKAALETAKQMAKSGASRDEIWAATGWFKGVDNKWRFEIDDSGAQWGGDYGVKHPTLYKAYRDTPNEFDIKWLDGGDGVAEGGYYPRPYERIVTAGDDRLSTGLHELQHAVQEREGFARGATVGEYARGPMFSQTARDMKDELSKHLYGTMAQLPSTVIQDLKYGDPKVIWEIVQKHGFKSVADAVKYLAEQDTMRTPYGQYRRTAGEVEARNVQARQKMTADERRAKAPWLTQDVPDDKQIVRFKGD